MVTERQAHIHVSGHPGRPEIETLYGWLKPEIVVPVHGERRHLAEHARFALSLGAPRAIVQQNGDVIRLAPNGPKVIGHERAGRLVLDGDVILPANGPTMNDRRKLAANGIVSVAIAVDKAGHAKGRPEIGVQGLPVEEDRADFIEDAAEAALDALEGGFARHGQAQGGDPPRSASPRIGLDGQEAGRRRDADPGLVSLHHPVPFAPVRGGAGSGTP